jgi:polyisoprenoid-binding protein YceI
MIRNLLIAGLLGGVLSVPEPLAPHRVDVNHSTVGFSVPILGGLSQVTGKFSRFEATIDYDHENPGESKVVAVIEAASLDTGIDDRDDHMRTDDFFGVEEHPEISFESFEVIPQEDGRLEVIGVLSLRGVEKDLTLDVQVLDPKDGKGTYGFIGRASFDRQEFGVRYKHRDIPDFIGDDVEITIHLLAHQR